jgi:cation diffusion facilitator CzcD-associated flavoprotein CzcO
MTPAPSARPAAAGPSFDDHAGVERVDVAIIGAGLSGVGAAAHFERRLPGLNWTILEARETLGGTWDLFRYPGIRSDSDMHTLGYNFRPWTDARSIADGPAILDYVRATADEHGIAPRIRYRHKVVAARWSSAAARWLVEIERGETGERVRLSAGFLMMCSGYYRYDRGYTPDFPGRERFAGRFVHPQFWTPDIDHAGKDVVVIGSGATAVTLVPELVQTAKSVVMLQRSPTYIVARPRSDRIAAWLRKRLSPKAAYAATRWKNVVTGQWFFSFARRRPKAARKLILGYVAKVLGDRPVEPDFSPRYDPWDQRLCLAPDGDFFQALRRGRADVVTGEIETFTETGVRLASGRELPADIIVSATGLELLPLGGVRLAVDGAPVELPRTFAYKGMMYAGVPNLISVFGYTNASWTLKCDLTCEFACRLLARMRRRGEASATPRPPAPGEVEPRPWADFSSGYVQRSLGLFPVQGHRRPWRLDQNYALDILNLRFGRLDDGVLEFRPPPVEEARPDAAPASRLAAE